MTEAPEPEDKLDAATTMVVVNGPEDATLRLAPDRLAARSRRRTAVAAADLHGVEGGGPQKGPQSAEVDAPFAREHAVERAAGDRAQRRSSDGGRGRRGGAHPEAKLQAGRQDAARPEPFKALPVRRVYIPKQGAAKRRPLGIPVIVDRCHQARVVNALEPEWEARFEPRSYGFRPGRGCHDAIQAIYQVVKGKSPKRRWVLDADLAGAFDRIAHDHILTMLGTFPARGMIRAVAEGGRGRARAAALAPRRELLKAVSSALCC